MNSEKKNLLVIDGYGFVFRAYHVQPGLTTPDGKPIGAVYGFTSMLLKILSDFKPLHAVMVFDAGGKNFRHKIYDQYKANRPPAPEDLIQQLSAVREAASSLNFSIMEMQGYEADDLIATIAAKATSLDENIIIISADKDLMQLLSDNIKIYDPLKNKYITEEDVIAKFGVKPPLVREVMALMGDKSDNIPGVSSVGPKTAAELINEFGSVKNLLNSIDQIQNKRRQSLIREQQEMAQISWQLVGLDNNVDIEIDFDQFVWKAPDHKKITNFLQKYGFSSLYKRASGLFNFAETTLGSTAPLPAPVLGFEKITSSAQLQDFTDKVVENGILSIYIAKTKLSESVLIMVTGDMVRFLELKVNYDLEANSATLNDNSYALPSLPLSLGPKRQGDRVFLDSNVAVAPSHDDLDGRVFHQKVNRAHDNFKSQPADLFAYSENRQSKIESETASENHFWFAPYIQRLLEDDSIKKITFALKTLLKLFTPVPINHCAIQDLELMQYAMQAGSNYDSQEIFRSINDCNSTQDLVIEYGKIVSGFYNEYLQLQTKLRQNKAATLYYDIDLPLCHVLHRMELAGIKVDLQHLNMLSEEFGTEIAKLEKEIFAICGTQFNIGSPKQLGEVLFEILKLPFGKLSPKAKTYATGAEVLEKISEAGHEIADLLLRWRHLTKLKTTYSDSLPKQINHTTGRIHTHFLQTSTSTGRLSSQEPNLQNIPIRSIEGSKLRAAFVATDGHKLISADYSQIELRILSHIANVAELKLAFKNGDDIHYETACKIFKLPKEEVTADHRRKAKAINFGIIYGISAFGLAKQLNISQSDAGRYIEQYFAQYPAIKDYMQKTKEFAKTHGYVENIFGRKCFVPAIYDNNGAIKQFAERAAINAPIQGSNADIIKIAMINIDKFLYEGGFKTKMLLQIHDELLFEAPIEEVDEVTAIIKSAMENAAILDTKLTVDIKTGDSWMK